ncbi:hypothetical protein [Mucilaginibacter phyllosphaerae]|uniref:Uncharacterized protein n=1 Tax=Mucilaginibacter phyllosphaerae TaxID=1812349 RepID=A0A4Y8A7F7_9SPHI|nr:hypothetical protein [Mucilaginibacter phyllosphaerae]MBB3970766.1 hypothetical protein [Mucilaginibacter phyllosphaerae]TEW64292.1 hypothetical protein E2R65_18270 [Mucilaginibacter phyllosphaerae]GGH04463.1 hypothetical protein GCM10007352_07690 [Mucilaginibacter phyllosphaerae]
MKYSEWNNLSQEDKKNTHWRRRPHVRTATIFSILFALVFIVFMLRVFQNRRMHVNRKPNAKEAFAIAKVFVNDKLKQPATASFPKSDFESTIDTAQNSYYISSTVDEQDSSGRMSKSEWQVKLSYTGGDWADRKSWKLVDILIK